MKRITRFFILLTITLTQTSLLFSQQDYLIKGFIFNSETNEPIPGANMVLAGTSVGTSSDAEGFFQLRLPSGEFTIRITSIGFSGKSLKITIPEEASATFRIGLSPKKHEIGEVDVFGTYFLPDRDTSINRIPVSILPAMTTISAVEIERQGAVTLVDAMKYVTGGWTETRGRKTKQFFTIRGQKYPYPDYSINGIWQKEFEETGYFLSALDIESVEIIRSSSALVRGLSGITGVVDVKTKKPERETLSLLTKYGALNSYVTNLHYGNKIRDFSFNASAGIFGTDGPNAKNGKERISNFHGNFDWKLNQKDNLQAGATYISGLRQLVSIDPESGTPNLVSRRERYDPVRTLLTYAKLNHSGNDGSRTEVQANFSYRDVDFADYNIPNDKTVWHDENDWEYGLNFLHSRPLSSTNTLRFGALYNHWVAPEGKRFYVGRSCNVHTFSGVVASEQKVGKFLFDAGVRLIGGHIVEWGGFGIGGAATGFQNVDPIENEAAPPEWQAVMGASYILSGASSFHYNFAGGSIAPRKGSLTNEGTTPNNEGRFQHDLGFRYKAPNRSEISIGTFFTKRNNSIDLSGQTIETENGVVMELYENIDKRSLGVELSAKLNVPYLNSYFFGNALYMKAESESAGKMTSDEEVPKVVLNGGWYFDYSRFDLNLFVNYTGPYTNNRFVSPAWIKQHGDYPLGDFSSVDLTAGYTFQGKLVTRLFVEVKNIMDQKFMTVAGYPDNGRIVQAGLKIKVR